ncbi:hypothetical protein M0R19_03495 [Candidatus Pacearchaeota archaeon]|jgi:hypothetical protein|nr:hypothetical protein [Candidatus Pacearchaeota archaeon]
MERTCLAWVAECPICHEITEFHEEDHGRSRPLKIDACKHFENFSTSCSEHKIGTFSFKIILNINNVKPVIVKNPLFKTKDD